MEKAHTLMIDLTHAIGIDITFFGFAIQLDCLLDGQSKSLQFKNLPRHLEKLFLHTSLRQSALIIHTHSSFPCPPP